MELTTNRFRKLTVTPDFYPAAEGDFYLHVMDTTSHQTPILTRLTAEEARQIADALDPDRADRRTTVRRPMTLDEARALVARLEAAEVHAAVRERAEGIEALARLMSVNTTHTAGYRGAAERAYDRGVRAPSAPDTDMEN